MSENKSELTIQGKGKGDNGKVDTEKSKKRPMFTPSEGSTNKKVESTPQNNISKPSSIPKSAINKPATTKSTISSPKSISTEASKPSLETTPEGTLKMNVGAKNNSLENKQQEQKQVFKLRTKGSTASNMLKTEKVKLGGNKETLDKPQSPLPNKSVSSVVDSAKSIISELPPVTKPEEVTNKEKEPEEVKVESRFSQKPNIVDSTAEKKSTESKEQVKPSLKGKSKKQDLNLSETDQDDGFHVEIDHAPKASNKTLLFAIVKFLLLAAALTILILTIEIK